MTSFEDWLRDRGIDSPRRIVRESDEAILVSKFEPGFAARLHDAVDRLPELFDEQCVRERYSAASADTSRVEAWRMGAGALLESLAPQRDLTRDQLAEIQAGVDSVAALLDSVLWTAPQAGDSAWAVSAGEEAAYGDALARMDDDSSIFTRYYGDLEGKRVENHCPGAHVARQLIGQAWRIVTGAVVESPEPELLLPSSE